MNMRKLILLLTLAIALSLADAVPAAALEVIGTPFGNGTGGVAVDPISGDVYQADPTNNRVVEYTESGTFILTFGKDVNKTAVEESATRSAEENICPAPSHSSDVCQSGIPGLDAGEFDYPTGVAVDPSTEDVYVNTGAGQYLGGPNVPEDNRVARFSSTGQYISQIVGNQNGVPRFAIPYSLSGIAVDLDGSLYVAGGFVGGSPELVLKFSPTGEYTGQSFAVKPGSPLNIAVDGNGYVYVSRGQEPVLKFAPNGVMVEKLSCKAMLLGAVAVDLSSNDIFVTGSPPFVGTVEIEPFVCRYDASGNKVDEFQAMQGKQPLNEMAYGASAGILYEVFSSGVWMYGTFPTPPQGAPVVSQEDWSNPGLTSMTLSARVNPHMLDTKYFFQYSTSPDLGGATDIPVPSGEVRSGFLPVSVSVTLTWLSQSTAYYYRLVAENSYNGGTRVEGPIHSFTTLAPLPSATTEGASEVTRNEATVNGTVVPGSVGAASETSWCFQYGTTDTPAGVYDLGFLPGAPAGDAGQGTGPVPVSMRLTRLQPETTYRYRLLAVNSLGSRLPSTACNTEGGHESDGAEGTFTTGSMGPGPVATSGSPTAISQSAAVLTGAVNPQGTSTIYDFQLGTSTEYGVDEFGEAGGGTETVPVSIAVSALQPGTSYHYRLVATSRFGTSYGADETFVTSEYSGVVLSAPQTSPLLETPAISFPRTAEAKPVLKKCRRDYTRNKRGRCVKVKRKKKKKK